MKQRNADIELGEQKIRAYRQSHRQKMKEQKLASQERARMNANEVQVTMMKLMQQQQEFLRIQTKKMSKMEKYLEAMLKK